MNIFASEKSVIKFFLKIYSKWNKIHLNIKLFPSTVWADTCWDCDCMTLPCCCSRWRLTWWWRGCPRWSLRAPPPPAYKWARRSPNSSPMQVLQHLHTVLWVNFKIISIQMMQEINHFGKSTHFPFARRPCPFEFSNLSFFCNTHLSGGVGGMERAAQGQKSGGWGGSPRPQSSWGEVPNVLYGKGRVLSC